jgi:cytochrome P450
MEKEGGALVDRPRSIALGEIMSGGMRMIMMSGGERFRRLRKAMHAHLQPKAAVEYQDMQSNAAKEAILDILNDPKNHVRHVQR